MDEFTVEGFGGLMLDLDPFEVATKGAVDLLNVDLGTRDVLRTRSGYSNVTSGAAAFPYQSLHFSPAGHLLGARQGTSFTTLEAINSSGAIADTKTGILVNTGAGRFQFATLGTPSAIRTYIATVSSGLGVLTWDGTAFAAASFSGAGTAPTATSLLATWKERLVSAPLLTYRMDFSDAGDPAVFSANNFVIPDPGDGETWLALIAWGDLLFAFRRTKMFVFYAISTDNDGLPIFNYNREVFGDIGSLFSVTPSPDGVFMLTSKGLYRTTGDSLTLVSEQPRALLGSLLRSTIPSDYDLLPSVAFENRLYFAAAASGSAVLDRVLVLDLRIGAWLLWDINARSLAVARFTGGSAIGSNLTFGVPSGHVARLSSAATTDAGTAIAWSYETGRYTLADGRVVVAPFSSLEGSGTVTLTLDSDLYTGQSGSATLGAAPATAEGWPSNVDTEGRWLQMTLSGSGVAAVHRVMHEIQSVKPVGVR